MHFKIPVVVSRVWHRSGLRLSCNILYGRSRNSGMKGSTILKSLQWCRKQADAPSWSFLDSPLIQGWQKSKVPADRQESLPLPLYVVVQWERRVLQANIPQHELLILGGFFLMIWSGLRYADGSSKSHSHISCVLRFRSSGHQLAYQDLFKRSTLGRMCFSFLISWHSYMA